jgi:hypothetical protein
VARERTTHQTNSTHIWCPTEEPFQKKSLWQTTGIYTKEKMELPGGKNKPERFLSLIQLKSPRKLAAR